MPFVLCQYVFSGTRDALRGTAVRVLPVLFFLHFPVGLGAGSNLQPPSELHVRHGARDACGVLEKHHPNASVPCTWKWDGVNGNSGVWAGVSTGGLRTTLKGDNPLWQAAVPFDSLSSPPPPPSWSNGGYGGARLWQNNTLEAFTSSHVLGGMSGPFPGVSVVSNVPGLTHER